MIKVTEKDIERKLKKYGESIGYLCYKFEAPGNVGVPDRIFINAQGLTIYIEVKSLKGRPSANQIRQMGKIRHQGAPVFMVYSVEGGQEILDAWKLKFDAVM